MEPFFIIGIIIIIGFLGYFLYSKTHIPESLILICVGLILGPITHIVPKENVFHIIPLFSTLALIIIILETGLSIDVLKAAKDFIKTFIFTTITVIITAALIMAFFSGILKWPWQHGLLLGIICGGTTTVSVASLMKHLNIPKQIKNLLEIESIINDILVIIFTLALLGLIKYENVALSSPILDIISIFSVGIIAGLLIGGIWLYVLSRIIAPHLAYIATLGVLFTLYDVAELIGGNGAVATLVFAMILGNAKKLNRRLNLGGQYGYANKLKEVNFNVSFLVTTFFFVLLGISFDASIMTWRIFFYSLLLLALAVAARMLCVKGLIMMDPFYEPYQFLITTILPRGVVATVLAFLIVKEGITIPYFTELVLIIILTTTITANLGAIVFYKKGKKRTSS